MNTIKKRRAGIGWELEERPWRVREAFSETCPLNWESQVSQRSPGERQSQEHSRRGRGRPALPVTLRNRERGNCRFREILRICKRWGCHKRCTCHQGAQTQSQKERFRRCEVPPPPRCPLLRLGFPWSWECGWRTWLSQSYFVIDGLGSAGVAGPTLLLQS